MEWNSVVEHANTTYPVKFREKENGFAIMQSRSITRWKQSTAIPVMIGGEGTNEIYRFFRRSWRI